MTFFFPTRITVIVCDAFMLMSDNVDTGHRFQWTTAIEIP
jgi:hypothetical protein